MEIPDISISSSIEAKVAWAESCHQQFRRDLLDYPDLRGLLERTKHAIGASRLQMLETGIVELCTECDQVEGGSCCGAGIENRYDGVLLLINCLLDVKMPHARKDPGSCFFLGDQGCLLQARHVICVNYVCGKITGRIPPTTLNALREKEGEELELIFLLHEQIKKRLTLLRGTNLQTR
jgi:hypothetical protein